jgi:glucuronate isomerase
MPASSRPNARKKKERIMESINQRVKSEIEKIPLIDTHEHIMREAERNEYAEDFSYFFPVYTSSDLVSAGMPPRLMEAARLPMYRYRLLWNQRRRVRRFVAEAERLDMSTEERWQAVEPYWEEMRNTAYAKATLIAIRDIFGIEDLNSKTYLKLSQAISDSRKPGWYRHVLKDKANIEVSLLDLDQQVGDVDRDLFAPVMRMDNFVSILTRQELGYIEADMGIAIHSLDDLVSAMQTTLAGHVKAGIVAVKSALAYERILKYDKVTRHEAEVVFNKIAMHLGEGPSFLEAKPLQDYMMHQVIRTATAAGLPMQFHTGLQEGNLNIITNANPTHLVNLFVEYREAKFDLMHGGYPYTHEWASLVKNFGNVYADLTWLEIISPEISRQLLHELIETVPGNKIMAFGGDSVVPEMAYGHARMARNVVARVLSEKISEGYMDEDEAVSLARKMLRSNPIALFKLPINP